MRNLRNLPTVLVYGALDEFVPVFESAAMLRQLRSEDAAPFDFYLNLDSDHLITFGINETRQADLSAGWQRPARVARVTYRVDPTLDVPAYGIVHDRAYWLSQIRARGPVYADVDLYSAGCGLLQIRTVDGSDAGIGPGPYAFTHSFRHLATSTPTAAAPELDGALANVASLALDVDAACLAGAAIQYSLQTDGPLFLQISDGRRLTLPAAGHYQGEI